MILKMCSFVFLLSLNSYAANLTFVNRTPIPVRVDSLSNKCQGNLVSPTNPLHLQVGESKTIKNAYPVVHLYTVCGNGLCSNSAIGLKNGTVNYTLNLVLNDGIIDLVAKPDHWVGNLDCENL